MWIRSGLIKGGFQEHQKWKNTEVCPCLTSAMGNGGGNIPIIIEVIEIESQEQHETRVHRSE